MALFGHGPDGVLHDLGDLCHLRQGELGVARDPSIGQRHGRLLAWPSRRLRWRRWRRVVINLVGSRASAWTHGRGCSGSAGHPRFGPSRRAFPVPFSRPMIHRGNRRVRILARGIAGRPGGVTSTAVGYRDRDCLRARVGSFRVGQGLRSVVRTRTIIVVILVGRAVGHDEPRRTDDNRKINMPYGSGDTSGQYRDLSVDQQWRQNPTKKRLGLSFGGVRGPRWPERNKPRFQEQNRPAL